VEIVDNRESGCLIFIQFTVGAFELQSSAVLLSNSKKAVDRSAYSLYKIYQFHFKRI